MHRIHAKATIHERHHRKPNQGSNGNGRMRRRLLGNAAFPTGSAIRASGKARACAKSGSEGQRRRNKSGDGPRHKRCGEINKPCKRERKSGADNRILGIERPIHNAPCQHGANNKQARRSRRGRMHNRLREKRLHACCRNRRERRRRNNEREKRTMRKSLDFATQKERREQRQDRSDRRGKVRRCQSVNRKILTERAHGIKGHENPCPIESEAHIRHNIAKRAHSFLPCFLLLAL